MSNVEMLMFLINQRLSVAVEEIFWLVELTIAEYEEQLCRSKEENERQQKLLDAVLSHQLRLHRADIQEVSGNKAEAPSEQQNWSQTSNQEDTELPRIKEEQEELWSSQEGQEEVHTTKLSISPVLVKGEDGEQVLQSTQPHQMQSGRMETGGDGEEEVRTSDSVSHLERSPGDQIFRCTECYKTYKHKSSLTAHMKSHSGEKLFCCSICNKRFIKRSLLNTHMAIHTGEKPYSCSFCNKRFIQRANMKSHMIVHTGEKPYSCKFCGLRFAWPTQLKRHTENKSSKEDCASHRTHSHLALDETELH